VDCSYYNEEARKIKNEFRFHQLFKDIAERFSQESHCLSKQVAALAVKNGRIIGTGINGTVAGDVNCDEYFK
jgi:dCMP deaminase